MTKIIGIGETVFDIVFKNGQPTAAVPGGSTFNALISLGRTVPKAFPEIPIMMVTEVGDDHVGDIITGFMDANGVSTAAVTRSPGTQSHLSLAFLDEHNDAQYEFYKDHAHAALSLDKLGEITFGKGDIVLFGSFFAINPVIRDLTRPLLVSAREAGATIYYDINFRKNHIKDLPETMANIEENCRLADFVRGSAEDFQYLFGCGNGREIYGKHIRPLCENFILTKGADPIEVFTPAVALEWPVEAVETVSTIGAGDNFNAGFIFSLLQSGAAREAIPRLSRPDWERMLSTAVQFSSAVCQSLFNYVEEGWMPDVPVSVSP